MIPTLFVLISAGWACPSPQGFDYQTFCNEGYTLGTLDDCSSDVEAGDYACNSNGSQFGYRGDEATWEVDTTGYDGADIYFMAGPYLSVTTSPWETQLDLFVQQGACDDSGSCVGSSRNPGQTELEFVQDVADGGIYYMTIDNDVDDTSPPTQGGGPPQPAYGCGENIIAWVGCTFGCDPQVDVDQVVTCSTELVDVDASTGSDSLDFYVCGDPDQYLTQANEEHIYQFTAPATGDVTFTVDNMSAEFDLYVLDASAPKGCHPDSCVEASTVFNFDQGNGNVGNDQVTFEAQQGETYYIVVEAYGGGGTFDFTFEDGQGACPENCSDGIDNDGDGLIDCDVGNEDPDCGCVEVFCDDSIDNDGDGDIDCADSDCVSDSACVCPDADGDGETDASCGGTDCNDANANVNTAAAEDCSDSLDNDCDGDLNCADGDCVSDPVCQSCDDLDGDGAPDEACGGNDCDDSDANNFPGNPEICDGQDNDCDDLVDDADDSIDPGLLSTVYDDTDGDGFGDPNAAVDVCSAGSGQVANPNDCDDSTDQRAPGVTETCDGIDNDCNGITDDGTECYDDDGDGFTENGGDCDDTVDTISPVDVEICDGVDQDCDGMADNGTFCYDDDGDCYCEGGICEGSVDDTCTTLGTDDCNDGAIGVNPGETETLGNGIDDDCDGSVDDQIADNDGDGYGSSVDCDDDDDTIYPSAPELADYYDNDCDGTIDEGTVLYDDDGDGFCEGFDIDSNGTDDCSDGSDPGDCNDLDDTIAPGASEPIDGVDSDCDGVIDDGGPSTDDDGDGISENQGDCDDANPEVYPTADEVENEIDDDCDGEIDEAFEDEDQDGFSPADGDCNDNDGWVNPELNELCDGIDNDCDDLIDEGCGDTPTPTTDETEGCGCQTGVGWTAGLWLLPLLFRRRR